MEGTCEIAPRLDHHKITALIQTTLKEFIEDFELEVDDERTFPVHIIYGKQVRCAYCFSFDHLLSDCRSRLSDKGKDNRRPRQDSQELSSGVHFQTNRTLDEYWQQEASNRQETSIRVSKATLSKQVPAFGVNQEDRAADFATIAGSADKEKQQNNDRALEKAVWLAEI